MILARYETPAVSCSVLRSPGGWAVESFLRSADSLEVGTFPSLDLALSEFHRLVLAWTDEARREAA